MPFQKLLYLREALRNTKLPQSKLKSIQNKKLLEIIRYSYKNVNYYKNLWKKFGIKAKDINCIEDLKKLPPINKKVVLKNYKNFISNEYKKYLNYLHRMPSFLFMRSTSGTSGVPFKIYFDPFAKNFLDAIYARALLKVGYNPTKPLLYYWWQQTPQKELYHLLGLYRKIYVPSSWDEEKQLKIMQTIKPQYIYYYPSALYFISRMILYQNVELNFKPKLIISHAEINTEIMRKTIENAFDTNVYDQYGSNEFNRIAWECREKNGYHVDSDSVLVEIVDENYDEVAPGEIGKILITGLVNKAIPLIRYEIGDFAIKADDVKHHCGINLPVLFERVEGRVEHSFKKNNKIVTQRKMFEILLDFFEKKKGVSKFQGFFKTRTNKLTINYIPFDERLSQKNYFGSNPKINEHEIALKKVSKINKNDITGKTLLFEKI